MRSLLFCTIVFAVAAACADPQTGETDADAQPAAEAAAPDAAGSEGLIMNTPEGGVLDWVADIDAGLDSVPALVGSDPSAAQNHVLTLYVMRQEYLEGYYGPGGRLEATPDLAAAIETNERRFHDLMSELAADAPDSARVVALTDSLAAQTARVREAAEAVDGELTPWSDAGS